jgi:hypothetical protein
MWWGGAIIAILYILYIHTKYGGFEMSDEQQEQNLKGYLADDIAEVSVGARVEGPNQIGMPESGVRVGAEISGELTVGDSRKDIITAEGNLTWGKTDVTSNIDSGTKTTVGGGLDLGYKRVLNPNLAFTAKAGFNAQGYDQRLYFGQGVNDPPAVGGRAEYDYNKEVEYNNDSKSCEQEYILGGLQVTTNNRNLTAGAEIGPIFSQGFGTDGAKRNTTTMAYNVYGKANVANLGKNTKLYVGGGFTGDIKGNIAWNAGLGVKF